MEFVRSLVYAWRALRRAPLFAAAIVITLTIGIGAATAIFTVVNAVLLRPLPYGHPEQLVGAWHDLPGVSMTHAEQTEGTYFTYRRFARTITGIAEYTSGSANVIDPDGRVEPERLEAAWTTANLFPLLEVPTLRGRTYTEAEDAPKGPNVVVISEGLWRSRFGAAANVIGQKLVIAGKPFEIIGVMPATFRFPESTTQLWMPTQLDPHDPFPGGFSYDAVARLKPGVSIAAADRDFADVLPRVVSLFPNLAPGVTTQMLLDQAKPVPRLVPMRDDVIGSIAPTLWIVAAAALLVLLVTCANVANLLLVRADGRHRELSVRAALGAGRLQVLAQFFTESALLAAVSSVLAFGVASIGIRLLVHAGPSEIPRLTEIHAGAATAGFAVGVALLVAIACSVIPAARFLRSNPLAGLREGGRSGSAGARRQRARSALVAAQMAFALMVLAASGLLFRSFERLRAVRPGFDADGVATLWLSLPSARYASDTSVVRFYATLIDQAARVPGIASVGITSRLPLETHGNNNDPFYPEGDATYDKAIPPLQMYTKTDGGYFHTMGIPLLAGRTFDRIDALRETNPAIVSQRTAAIFFHDSTGRAAIGKRFQELPNGTWHTIIGVVGTVRDTALAGRPTAAVYFPEGLTTDSLDGGISRQMALVARTTAPDADVAAATRSLERVVRQLDPTLPTYDVRSMRAVMQGSIARLSFTMIILGVAAAVTLALGIVGLYGVIAYIVTLRTREMGIRLALGAQPSAITRMVTGQGLALSAIGIVVGVALSLVIARFLRSLLFEVAPTDPLTLGAAAAMLIALALVASWIPARRAARVDPTEALRAE